MLLQEGFGALLGGGRQFQRVDVLRGHAVLLCKRISEIEP
jgi:hypothetical protein